MQIQFSRLANNWIKTSRVGLLNSWYSRTQFFSTSRHQIEWINIKNKTESKFRRPAIQGIYPPMQFPAPTSLVSLDQDSLLFTTISSFFVICLFISIQCLNIRHSCKANATVFKGGGTISHVKWVKKTSDPIFSLAPPFYASFSPKLRYSGCQ